MVPTDIPGTIRAGDTLKFTRSLSDYPADESWVLNYALTNASQSYTFAATADGATHSVTVAASTTDAWLAGTYSFKAYVEKSGERYTVAVGTVEIEADLSDGATDNRSHVKKTLDLVEAEVERRVTGSKESYSMPSGRSMTLTPMSELLVMQSKYRAWYQQEQQAERLARGLKTNRIVKVRF